MDGLNLNKVHLLAQNSSLRVAVPRDLQGEFEPQIHPKGQRRLPVIDERIIALYGSGLSTRDIQAHLHDVEVSAELNSTVADSVMESVNEWHRPLESVYTVVLS